METLLPGITLERVPTSRLTVAMLSITGRTGPAVLFVHGNVSSSLFWQPTMLALPEPYRPLAMDLRGFGDTDPEPVDATRGLRDYADDLAAAIEALGLDSVHLVGWSMGGGVVLQYLVDRPGTHRVASLTLARGAGLAAAAHGGADPRRAGQLRRGRRALPRGGDRGLRARSAPGSAGAVPGRAGRASGRFVSAATRSAGRRRRARCRFRGAGQQAGRPRLVAGGSRHHAGRACGAGGARDGLDQDRR